MRCVGCEKEPECVAPRRQWLNGEALRTRGKGLATGHLTSSMMLTLSETLVKAAGFTVSVFATVLSLTATGTGTMLGWVPGRGSSLVTPILCRPMPASPMQIEKMEMGLMCARVRCVTRLLPLSET